MCVADLLGDVADIDNTAGVKLRPVIDHENDVGPGAGLYCRGDPRLNVVGVDRLEGELDAERFVGLRQEFLAQKRVGGGHEIVDAQPVQRRALRKRRRTARGEDTRDFADFHRKRATAVAREEFASMNARHDYLPRTFALLRAYTHALDVEPKGECTP